ncbi:MAG: dihydropteroate synthase, partial [Pseudomonadota bacterium]
GGRFADVEDTLRVAASMAEHCDILDVGGESTRPGAEDVAKTEEIARTAPVIEAMRRAGVQVPISIDTRKGPVAEAALSAGANIVNDVSAFTFDPSLAGIVAEAGVPVVLMHAQGTPDTMQEAPSYADVVLDVYDHLAERIAFAEAAGISRQTIAIDPGIGFGKTQEHNLALLRNLSLFHGLGCPILLGVSRKGFIGRIGGAQSPADRMPGSLAVGLLALGQGVQILRVHDTVEHAQALRLWEAIHP